MEKYVVQKDRKVSAGIIKFLILGGFPYASALFGFQGQIACSNYQGVSIHLFHLVDCKIVFGDLLEPQLQSSKTGLAVEIFKSDLLHMVWNHGKLLLAKNPVFFWVSVYPTKII